MSCRAVPYNVNRPANINKDKNAVWWQLELNSLAQSQIPNEAYSQSKLGIIPVAAVYWMLEKKGSEDKGVKP
jgi:hypothetical protein